MLLITFKFKGFLKNDLFSKNNLTFLFKDVYYVCGSHICSGEYGRMWDIFD